PSTAPPFAKVILTTFLEVSPVQIIPSWDHTGTPLHFHSSTTSGSARLMRPRIRESTSPRQSGSSFILASISLEGDSGLALLGMLRPSAAGLPELAMSES